MSVKKTRALRFTWQDKDGKLRVVHISAQHMRTDGGDDEVRLHITSDGVSLIVDTFVESIKVVKTRSRL